AEPRERAGLGQRDHARGREAWAERAERLWAGRVVGSPGAGGDGAAVLPLAQPSQAAPPLSQFHNGLSRRHEGPRKVSTGPESNRDEVVKEALARGRRAARGGRPLSETDQIGEQLVRAIHAGGQLPPQAETDV